MIDINLIRDEETIDLVKENIKKKFQDEKLPLVDDVYDLDIKVRKLKAKGDELRARRNSISSEIGILMKDGKNSDAEKAKDSVGKINEELIQIEKDEEALNILIKEKMLVIPNIIDESVPIGKDDTENVEIERYGEALVPDFEIPHHADICEKLGGLDKDAAGRTSGNGFYYLVEENETLQILKYLTNKHGIEVNCCIYISGKDR